MIKRLFPIFLVIAALSVVGSRWLQAQIDSKAVGANQRPIYLIGDNSVASQTARVTNLADGQALAAQGAVIVEGVPTLLNAAGNYDQGRSAPGTTGIPSVNFEGTKATFSVGTIAFTPAATATDFWQITGSASKTIRVLRVAVYGTATSAGTVDLQMIKRTTADTGGSPSALTPMLHDSNDSSATAVVNTFGANPSGLGTGAGVGRVAKFNLAAAAGPQVPVLWVFTGTNDKAPVLRTANQSLNLNWNGAAVPAGTVLDIEVMWSEE